MKIMCPWCGEEMEDFAPMQIKEGDKVIRTVYKKVCYNREKHYGNGNIIIPYKPKEEK